jgi:hypothetical protein
VKTIVPGS